MAVLDSLQIGPLLSGRLRGLLKETDKFVQSVHEDPRDVLGIQRLTVDQTVRNLPSVPGNVVYADVWTTGTDVSMAVMWRDDGTDPTTTDGLPIAVGGGFYAADYNWAAFRCRTREASGTINLYIRYSR